MRNQEQLAMRAKSIWKWFQSQNRWVKAAYAAIPTTIGIVTFLVNIVFPAFSHSDVPRVATIEKVQFREYKSLEDFCKEREIIEGKCQDDTSRYVKGAVFRITVAVEGLKGGSLPIYYMIYDSMRNPVVYTGEGIEPAGVDGYRAWPAAKIESTTNQATNREGEIWVPSPPVAGDYTLHVTIADDGGPGAGNYDSYATEPFYWQVSIVD